MLGTIRDSFAGNVSRWPDRPALIYGERTYSYADLNASANRLAHYLSHLGVGKGDGVGLLRRSAAAKREDEYGREPFQCECSLKYSASALLGW